ncbi:hypothetical protein OSTOST_10120, partial [Ostertagia ostertagi]
MSRLWISPGSVSTGNLSTIGIASNLLSFFVMIRHNVFKNSFGLLAACYAITNAFILVICAGEFLMVCYTKINRMGQLSFALFEATILCILFISLNRFTAITFPLHYSGIFTKKATYGIFAFISVVYVLWTIVLFIDGCNFFYDHAASMWIWSTGRCGEALFDIDLYYNGSLIAIFTVIDIVTIVQLKLRGQVYFSTQKGSGVKKSKAAGNILLTNELI